MFWLISVLLRFTGNVAYNKFAEQAKNSSRPPTSYYAERAGLAVDGNQDPYVFKCAHTFPGNGYDNWWRVDLGATYVVQSINITNVRPDNCCQCEYIRISRTTINPLSGDVITYSAIIQQYHVRIMPTRGADVSCGYNFLCLWQQILKFLECISTAL